MPGEEDLYGELKKNFEKRDRISQKLIALHEELRVLTEEAEAIMDQITTMKKSINSSGTPNWEYLLDESSGNTARKALQKALEGTGLYVSGYYPETSQHGIQISLARNDKEEFERTYSVLESILPYIKPFGESEVVKGTELVGCKLIRISERTLSEHGIYIIAIDEAKEEYKCIVQTYGSFKVLETFQNLRDLLLHVQENYYYDTKS